MSVGISADTREFAVESIRRWWKTMGRARYGTVNELSAEDVARIVGREFGFNLTEQDV